MKPGTVSIRYSTRRMSDGYAVAAVAENGEVLGVVDRVTTHGYALKLAQDMAEKHGLPLIDNTTDENGFAEPTEPRGPRGLTTQQDWQETVNRLND
jgi:hypothetical protein